MYLSVSKVLNKTSLDEEKRKQSVIISITNLLHKPYLRTFCASDTVLAAGDMVTGKTDIIPFVWRRKSIAGNRLRTNNHTSFISLEVVIGAKKGKGRVLGKSLDSLVKYGFFKK